MWLAIAGVAALPAWSDSGQTDSAAATTKPAETPSQIQFSFRGATYQQVIDFFSRATGLPVIWETSAPEGTLDYVSPHVHDLPDAMSILNLILQSKGVMLRVSDRHLYLQKLDQMQREDIPTYVGQLPADLPPEQIITVVRPLSIALAKPLAEKLSAMVASYGAVAAIEQQNALMITETAANARRILLIVDQLDKQDTEGAVEIFPVRYAKATELMTPLKALLSQRVEKFVINQQGQQVKIEEDQMPGLSIGVDERTNSIIAKGLQAKIDKLRETIGLLDVPAAAGTQGRTMTTLQLARTAPADAAAKLNALYAKIDEKKRPTVVALDDAMKVTILGEDPAVAEGEAMIRELEGGTAAAGNQDAVMTVVALEHAAPSGVVGSLNSLLNKRQQIVMRLVAGPDGRSIIISGPTHDVEAVKSLLPVLDRQSSVDRQVRLVRIAQGDAGQIFEQARRLFDQQKTPGLNDPQMAVAADLDAESRVVRIIGAAKGLDAFTAILRQLESTVVIDREAKRIELANVLPSEIVAPLTALATQLLQPDDGSQYVPPTFTALDQLNLLVVSATPQQLAALDPLIASLDVSNFAGETPPIRLLQLRIADAPNLANVIMSQYNRRPAAERRTKPVNVAADPQTNALIVAAHADVFPEIEQLVEELNTTEHTDLEGREIRIVSLKIARAEELARTIDAMFPQPPVPLDVRGRPQPHLQKPRDLVASFDRQTNSLILAGRPAALSLAEQMAQQLDVDPGSVATSAARSVRVFTLLNADAVQLAANLEAIFASPELLGQKPAIRVDGPSNSLIVRATDEQFKAIEDVVGDIDRAAIATSRQMRLIPIDPSKTTAEDVANTLQRLLDRSGATKVQVITLEELLKRNSPHQSDAAKDEPSKGSSSSRLPLPALIASLAIAMQAPAPDQTPPESDVTIAVDPATNSLVIIGSQRAVERVSALVKQLQDQIPAAPGTIRYLTLPANVDVQTLHDLVNQTLDKVAPAGGQPGDLRRRVGLIPDAAGNALIIASSDADFEIVADLIAALSKPASSEFPVRTITLQRAEAAAVARAIQQFFDDRAKLLQGAGRRQAQRRVSLMGIETSNTLLVSASDADFQQIEELVAQFDTAEAATGLTFRVFQLRHARAAEIERTVQSLVNDLTWQGEMFFWWQPRQESRKRDTIAVRADGRLNALIVTGRGDKFAVVEKVIEVLDVPVAAGDQKVVRIYPVQNATLQTVADVVREVFNAGRQRRPWEPPDPGEIRVRTDDASNLLIISATAKEQEDIARLIASMDEQVAPANQQTVVLPVKFGRAAELAWTLTRFFADRARATNAPRPAATIVAADSANTLIVSAPHSELATIRDLLSQLDSPDVTGDRVTEIIALQQGDAQEVGRILREQFGRRSGGGQGVVVTVDPRTNSLVVSAPQQEFAQARALIERLDSPSAADETVVRTYALKGAQASEAVRILTQTLQLDATGRTPGKGTTIKLEGSDQPAVEVKARVVADRRSNSLIVTATPQSLPVVEALIRQLEDVPAASPVEWRIFTLKHALASEVTFTLDVMTRSLATDTQARPRIDYDRLKNQLIVAATADQFKQIEQMVQDLDQPPQHERVTEFVALKFAQAEQVREALSVFYGPFALEADTPGKRNVRIVADPASNSLVISANQDEWQGIRALLAKLDSQEYDATLQLKVIALVHADAASVARAINEAFQGQVTGDQRSPGARTQPRPRASAADDPQRPDQIAPTVLVQSEDWVRASAEPQTNSVIISASRQNIAKIEQIIQQLDVAEFAKLPPPRIIPVASGDPLQLAQTLTQMFERSRGAAANQGGAKALRIAGNAAASSLIVRADPEEFEQIRALAESLQQQAGASGLLVHVLKLNAAPAGRVAAAISDAFQAKAKAANQPLSIRVDAPGNSLIIASTAALLEEIRNTAAQLDAMAPTAGQGIFIIELQNIPPEAAKGVIENIGLDKPPASDATARIVSEPVKVSLLAGRNAIIVVANPADRETIVGLMKAIDSDPSLAEMTTRVIKLKNAQATALAQVLAQLLKPSDQQADTPLARAIREQVRRLSVRSDDPTEQPFQLDLGKPVRLISDPSLNALVVSSTPQNIAAIEQLVAMFDQLPITDAVTVQIYPLQNIAAEQFARILKDLFTQGKQLGRTTLTRVPGRPEGAVGKALLDELAITIDERTNTVIVAGTADSVALVEVMAKRIDSDVAAAWVEPRVIPLRYADAVDLAQSLNAILVEGATNLPQSSPLQRQIGRLRMARLKPAGGAANHTPTVVESDVFVPMTRLVIRAEPQMNALIVVGTPDNLELIGELVAMLDVEAASPTDVVRIYPVTNASASRLSQLIKQMFDQQVQSKAIRPEDRVIIQADERTNALVVATSPRSFAVFEHLLKTLDVPMSAELREIRTIELKNASAPRVASLIQQMMDARLERLRRVQPETADLERASIVADPRTNSLVVAAGNDTFEVIRRLAGDLDVSTLGDAALVQVLPVDKSTADRIATAVNQIMQRRYAALPQELSTSQRPLVLTDPRSNSLLVAANQEDLAVIQDLVAKLSATPTNPAVGITLVPVAPTARAEILAPKLQRLMQAREQSLGSGGSATDRVSIEPDLATNSLIVAASHENLAVIRTLLDELVRADAAVDPSPPSPPGGVVSAGVDREVELIPLLSSRAADVIELLNELYVDEANRTRGQGTIRISADDRVNAILVNASPRDIRALKNLVAQLDGAKPASVVEIKYIPLQSANAVETVSLIENVLSGRGIGPRRTTRQATVLKYLREIAREQGAPPSTQPDGEGPVEMEVSAAIRESITLTPDLRTNTIIVSAPRESMNMIERMIRDLDASSTGAKSIRIFKLVNADALAMAEIITDLFNLRQGSSLYVLKPREGADAMAPGAAIEPSAAPAAGLEGGLSGTELTAVPDERQQLSITVDSRTNSLIVSGTPTYLDLVTKVVEELDKLEANEREVFVYQLRNATADEVARVVGEFVSQEQQKLISTLSADQLGSAARLLEREITIQGDVKSNSVLVSASPRYIDRVREIITKLDVDPPQVLIQVMLAEVTLDSRDEWGVDFNVSGEIGSADVSAGFDFATAFVTGLGVPNIAIASSDFELLIRAMKSQGRLQVLSNPSIMAANNAPARIQVGETIRLPVATSITDAGRIQSTLEKEDLGVILEVTPSINPDGFVRMTISPEISSLSARTTQISEDFQSPIIIRRTADTTVTVRDGQTIVIGGLISDRYERRDRKVPLLGDIPVVGLIFRSNTEETAKTELLIVLTPHVIESPAHLGRVGTVTNFEIDRLSLPREIKNQIRRSILDGTGGLYDAEGNRIEVGVEEEER